MKGDKIYTVLQDTREIAWSDREEIKTLCVLDQRDTKPATIGEYKTEKEAMDEARKYSPRLTEGCGHDGRRLYTIEETYVEAWTDNGEGEFDPYEESYYDTPWDYAWNEEKEDIDITEA